MGTVKNPRDALLWQHLKTERPNAKQIEFFRSKALHTMYGGARGGGKSWAVRRKAVLLCITYAGLRVLLLRRTMPELRENHILPLSAELDGYAKYRQDDRAFLFPNGSRLKLGYCDCDSDMLQYQGNEYDAIFFEEATNLCEEWIRFISTTLRSVRTDGFKPRIYYTCNPGGVSHAYFKRLFIDRQFTEGENPDDYLYIPATVYDNDVLMARNPEYIKQLEALPEAKRRAHLEGDWNVFEGAFFAEFRAEVKPYARAFLTHVCEPFALPDTWPIYRSFDWGCAKPFSCDWWAVDYDGRAYLVHQFYGCQMRGSVPLPDTGLRWTADRVFSEIHRIETEHKYLMGKNIIGVADPAIWAEDGGEAIVAAADRHGVYFTKADHTRLAGWMQCRYRLAFGEDKRPMVYFFSTCRHALRTLPLLQYSDTNPEDLNTKQEDHFADSFRYFCMMAPLAPRVPAPVEYQEKNPLQSARAAERISYK